MDLTNDGIKKAILKSQHCQRNWDLSQFMPKEDQELLATAVSQCPSKQNVAYYRAHFVTNRELIERIHNQTDGFTISYEPRISVTNPQVLAQLLVVFEEIDLSISGEYEKFRNDQTKDFVENQGQVSDVIKSVFDRDRNMAVGIAAGYLNLTATLLGYSTGCCACFDPAEVQKILKLEKAPLLLMGIGIKDDSRERRVHHMNNDFVFPTKRKQPIDVSFID